jgi:SprB repeat
MHFRASARFGLFTLLTLAACQNKEIPTGPDCTDTPLGTPTAAITDASSCTAADGQVEVTAIGGIAPYQYAFNSGTFQASAVFSGLSAGTYPITVQDSRGCTINLDVTVGAAGSTFNASASTTADTECFPPHTGSITVSPVGGNGPYEVKFGNGAFGSALSFTALEKGSYTLVVRDADNCTVTLGVEVPRGDTGVSFASDIQPIINTNCALGGCHVAGTSLPSFTTYSGVSSRAASIKLRTANGSMPPATNPDLTVEQIKLIACWVDDGAKNN